MICHDISNLSFTQPHFSYFGIGKSNAAAREKMISGAKEHDNELYSCPIDLYYISVLLLDIFQTISALLFLFLVYKI